MSNEADTCRKYVVPKLTAAGWDSEPRSIAEQHAFTDGRIMVSGNTTQRRQGKRADYLLRYTRDYAIAVVEAKAEYKTPGTGMQQAKEYAEILGLKFAYATNGTGIIEFDYTTGIERTVDTFPTPGELWARLTDKEQINADVAEHLLMPYNNADGKKPRYYQEIAINTAVQHILQGKRRTLLTMATGTGKTFVAFQICWKLWNSRWTRAGQGAVRRPRILYLADRNFLVDDPKDRMFVPFGDARYKIENGKIVKSREMYFAIYQAIARDENRPGLYKEFARDFFDLIIVDECHRGSASDDSNWREILEYFEPAYQLGMTATPLREDNKDTYLYFGNPIYVYSLKQGIEDGFLAPYQVHRVVTSVDAAGWRPEPGTLDRYKRLIPDEEYHTPDFDRKIALWARTQAIAKHLTNYMRSTDRMAKTIVFCADQEHADEMRRALNNLNADLVKQYPDYVCRVTADEGDIGRGHLGRFQDVETLTPVILTTSQLLTTGVDAPMCKNIVIARTVESMTEFKQIIGRGTRVRDDLGKVYFTILDYTGSATRKFADPEFDGIPEFHSQEEIDEYGNRTSTEYPQGEEAPPATETTGEPPKPPYEVPPPSGTTPPGTSNERRKYYFDGGSVEIVAQMVLELDADGKQINVTKYSEYAAKSVRTLYRTTEEMRALWANPDKRNEVIDKLAWRGVLYEHLAEVMNQPDADPFDLLCHVAFSAPLYTRRERAARLRKHKQDFFAQYGPDARAVLSDLLDKYAAHGTAEFVIPDALKVQPISERGNVSEIIGFFGGAEKLKQAVNEMQVALYRD